MWRTVLGFVGFLAALGSGKAAVAQEMDVTVTGQREVKRDEAQRFVGEVRTTVNGQFARFREPVCPTVMGIPDEFAAIVEKRFRAVAQEAEVPTAAADCAPNIIVIVASDADKLVRDMRDQAPGLFRGLDLTDIRKAMRDGPVHVWSTVETRNEDGMGASASAADGGTPAARGGPPTAGAATMQVRSASIIDLPVQQVAVQSVMVIDDDAALGKTLTQIADYAAMRTLAGARPPKRALPTDTILTLFDSEGAPPTASAVDRSYLKGLYASRAIGKGLSQASTIARTINRDSRERSGVR